jgi:hypothetical protein
MDNEPKAERVDRDRAAGALVGFLVFFGCALFICGFIVVAALEKSGLGVAGLGLALIYVSFRMRSTFNEWLALRIRTDKQP